MSESTVANDAQIGPWCHLRPGSVIEDDVHLGNFVETKKTRMGKGAKANHLTYLGDADVGAEGQRRLRHHHLQLRRLRQVAARSSRTARSSAPTRSWSRRSPSAPARSPPPAPPSIATCPPARWRSRAREIVFVEGWAERKRAAHAGGGARPASQRRADARTSRQRRTAASSKPARRRPKKDQARKRPRKGKPARRRG